MNNIENKWTNTRFELAEVRDASSGEMMENTPNKMKTYKTSFM